MQLERKRSYHAEVSAATTKSPEQIGILIGVCVYKCAVRQYDVGCEQIIDGQSAFAGQMPDASAQGESANSCRGDDSTRSSKSKRVRGMIYIAPRASATDGDGSS